MLLLLSSLDTCEDSEYFLLPFCYTECPKYFFAANRTTVGTEQPPYHYATGAVCQRCHPTCSRCSGNADNQCLNCSIHRRLTVDHECVDVHSEHRRLPLLVVAAICTLPVAVIGIATVSVWLWMRRRRTANRSPSQLVTNH